MLLLCVAVAGIAQQNNKVFDIDLWQQGLPEPCIGRIAAIGIPDWQKMCPSFIPARFPGSYRQSRTYLSGRSIRTFGLSP